MKTRPRVFLDTNVYVFGFERPLSNSSIIIKELSTGTIEAVISERVFKESIKYFRRNHTKKTTDKLRLFLLTSSVIMKEESVREEMKRLGGKVKPKDLENLAVVRTLGLRYMVSVDRHFESFPEYITPREFVNLLGLRPTSTKY